MATCGSQCQYIVVLWWWICCCCFRVGFFTVKDQLFDLTSLVRSEMIDWVAAKQATLCGESISPMHQHIQSYRDTTGNIQVGSVFFFVLSFLVSAFVRTTKIKKCVFLTFTCFYIKTHQQSMTFLHEKKMESEKSSFFGVWVNSRPTFASSLWPPRILIPAVKMGGFWAVKTPPSLNIIEHFKMLEAVGSEHPAACTFSCVLDPPHFEVLYIQLLLLLLF